MKGNKKYIFISLAICVIILICGAVFFIIRNFVSKDILTRYEWIEMLCNQSGMTEYQNEEPYYTDVGTDNKYFPYIQSAAEWGVIDGDTEFEGENHASWRFVALTAMKTVGAAKLKNYLGADEITDDIYIGLAIEHGLVGEGQLEEGLSIEEGEQVLENLKKLYFSEFWPDDYSEVTYQDGVAELPSDDILQSNIDGSQIVVTKNTADSLGIGTIIVFDRDDSKVKTARKITKIDADGTLTLSPAECDEVIESLVVSDIAELTFEDIINYYGLEENTAAVNNLNYQQTDVNIVNTAVFKSKLESKGYKLSVSTEDEGKEKHIEVKITDNDNGKSYKLPINEKVDDDDEYSAEIDIDRLCLGGQVSYSVLSGLGYADVAVDAHATLKCAVDAEKDKKFLLCKALLPLAGGVVTADIRIYIVLSVEGSISLEAELPVEASVSYEKGRGLKNAKHNIAFEEPTAKVNCDAGAMLRIEPVLAILGTLNVIDAEADIGASASAEAITRPTSRICVDISASFPIITLAVSGDDDVETVIGKLGWSKEWEIISSDDAPIKKGFHYEIPSDARARFVEKCTYKEDDTTDSGETDAEEMTDGEMTDAEMTTDEMADDEMADVEAVRMGNTYYTKYKEMTGIDSPVFCFDYPNNWSISKEAIKDGSTFGEYEEETVELTNERDIKITFIKFNSSLFELGGNGRNYVRYLVEKVTDSGNFAVVKLTVAGNMHMDVDSDFGSVDNGNVSYALIPESAVGSGGTLEANGFMGYYEMIAFDYTAPYAFFAESPDGKFTEEEETEITAILSSFREAP